MVSLARDQGEGAPLAEKTLWKRFKERGYLLSHEPGRNTVRKQGLHGASARTYALHLDASMVSNTEPSEPSEPAPVVDSAGHPAYVAQSENASEPQIKTEPRQSPSETAPGASGSDGAAHHPLEGGFSRPEMLDPDFSW